MMCDFADKKLALIFPETHTHTHSYRAALLEQRQLPSVKPTVTVCSCLITVGPLCLSGGKYVSETERERKRKKIEWLATVAL